MNTIIYWRYQLVRYALEKGIRATARVCCCDRKTVQKWLRRYLKLGMIGLTDKTHTDWTSETYGRSVRERCPLTIEQRKKWCTDNCEHWAYCSGRERPIPETTHPAQLWLWR